MGLVFQKVLEDSESNERSGEKWKTKKKCGKGNEKKVGRRRAKFEEHLCQKKETGKTVSEIQVLVQRQNKER